MTKGKLGFPGKIVVYAILLILVFCAVFPLLWMFISSFKTESDFTINRFGLPKIWTVANYVNSWGRGHFSLLFRNSIIVAAFSLVLMVGSACMTSFAFTRYHFKFSGKVLFYFLVGQMLSTQTVLIPVYLELIVLKLNNTLIGLALVYVAAGLPFAIFLLQGFFIILPHELYEAAEIDGCTELGIFAKIALPLAKPGIASALIIQFLFVWNEFPLALVALSSANVITLPVGIYRVVNDMYSSSHTLACAGLAITALPIIAVYAFFQRQILEGITAGAIKG